MKPKKLVNPFPTSGYFGPNYFCNRKEETLLLLRNIENGNSTTIISLRRIGKTGLIQHVFGQLPHGWKGIYIDILSTENLNEFLNTLATAIIQTTPQNSSIGKKFWNFIQSLRPVITFDSLTGMPQASFDFTNKNTELNISNVLNFLDKQEFKTVIAIDEFQQILNYPQKNTDAWLRSIIQQLKNVVFIFSGSQQHIMTEMFTSPNKPFFRSTQFLKLNKIDNIDYARFIIKLFKNNDKHIDHNIVTEVLEWCNTHTYYVQTLFNRIFSVTSSIATNEIWQEQAKQLLKEQELIFIGFRILLTSSQWKLLKAIALEERVYSPTSKDFISKYNLGSSAALLRALNSLRKYELIYNEADPTGKIYYSVYDVFFQQWCKEKSIY